MVEREDVYDQAWEGWPPVSRHVKRYLEELFGRLGEPYDLPTQAPRLRQDFRRFLKRELPRVTKLVLQDREAERGARLREQAQQRKPRRKRRSADPDTREDRRSVLQFVVRRAVPVASLLRGKLTVGRQVKWPYHALAKEWRRSHPHTSLTADSLKTICSDTRKDRECTSALLSDFQAEFDRQYQWFRENPPSYDHLCWLARLFTTGIPSPLQEDYQCAIHLAAGAYALNCTPDGCPGARRLRAIGRRFLRNPLLYAPGLLAYPEPTVADEAQGEPIRRVVLRSPDGREKVLMDIGDSDTAPPPA